MCVGGGGAVVINLILDIIDKLPLKGKSDSTLPEKPAYSYGVYSSPKFISSVPKMKLWAVSK